MVEIDAFKATAFKLHNAPRLEFYPKCWIPRIGQMKRSGGTVEAFLEVGAERAHPTNPISYRAGYRCVETGEIICSIEIPASIAESTIFAHSNLLIATTPDGHIKSAVRGLDSDLNTSQLMACEPLDASFARSLDSENLRMEEATVADLEVLLQRLNHSTNLVREAIGRMENESKSPLQPDQKTSGSDLPV
jgi:hypothetical protein